MPSNLSAWSFRLAISFALFEICLSHHAWADSIYFADIFVPTLEDGAVRRIRTDGLDVQSLIPTGGGLRSLDVDIAAGKIYWIDVNSYAIRRANLNGTGVEDLITTGLSFPSAIAVDAAGGKIYWGDQTDEQISRANLDGSDVELVLGTPFHRGIAIDSVNAKVYWTTSLTPTRGEIARCNFNGSGHEIVIAAPGSNFKPSNLALDIADGKVYWTDGVADVVRRANLDGTNMETLYNANGNNPRGIRLDIPNGTIYWGQDYGDEPTLGRIMRMPLSGTSAEFVASELGLVNDLALVPGDPPPLCPGDLDGDLTVGLQDLAQLLAHFGTAEGAAAADGDLDADADVDLQDLASLLAIFGTICT